MMTIKETVLLRNLILSASSPPILLYMFCYSCIIFNSNNTTLSFFTLALKFIKLHFFCITFYICNWYELLLYYYNQWDQASDFKYCNFAILFFFIILYMNYVNNKLTTRARTVLRLVANAICSRLRQAKQSLRKVNDY